MFLLSYLLQGFIYKQKPETPKINVNMRAEA